MKFAKLIPAICISGALLGATAPAAAYPHGDHWRDRGPYHEGWRHDGWRDGYHRQGWHDDRRWRRWHGGERHCWWEWHHHARYRVCR